MYRKHRQVSNEGQNYEDCGNWWPTGQTPTKWACLGYAWPGRELLCCCWIQYKELILDSHFQWQHLSLKLAGPNIAKYFFLNLLTIDLPYLLKYQSLAGHTRFLGTSGISPACLGMQIQVYYQGQTYTNNNKSSKVTSERDAWPPKV